jgi:hypothetical protein
MDIDNYTPNDLKKLFTKGTGINFLNDYTFQDVEDGKKKLYLQLIDQYQSNKEKLKNFLDRAGKTLMEDKITNGFDKPIGIVVKNTVKDNLNPDYKNTIKRLINIDSQYIPLNATSSYVFKLTEKLVNVVSIELTNLQIPMTFYNIESRQGNNFFYIYPYGQIGNLKTIEISDGNYSLETLIPAVHTAVRSQFGDISFSIDSLSGKTTFTSTSRYTIEFYEDSMTETTKINHCLGWILGFHKTPTEYENPSLIYDLNTTLTSDKVAYVGTTKNIIVVLDEFSQNQTSGTMVQTINDINTIKPSSYYANSKVPKNSTFSPLNLDCLTPTNINTEDQMKTALTNTGLTRAQIYTRAQVNHNKTLVNNQTCYLEPNTQNNVLAIVPFESVITLKWGHKYFTDKNKYVRQYHGPVEIEKMQVRLYDEKGFELDFNGANWSVTMITEHLYKY